MSIDPESALKQVIVLSSKDQVTIRYGSGSLLAILFN